MPKLILVALVLLICGTTPGQGADEQEPRQTVTLADGALTMQVPAAWQAKQPRVRIIQYEFSIPPVEPDQTPGRLTIMAAGGGVQANIDRWIGQFEQPDGKATRDLAQIQEKEVAGQKVHLVDLAGTYRDQRGPFGPVTLQENYRMLGAIISTEQHGHFFLKLYGPRKTIAAAEKDFQQMIQSLKVR